MPQQTAQLTATTRDASNQTLSGRPVSWSSSAPAVVTVSTSGTVTAIAEGSATITATSEGRSGTATITMTPISVSVVELSVTADTLEVGHARALEATTRHAVGALLVGRAVVWSSSAPAVATVNGGVVTAVTVDVATVTATSEGQGASAEITVRPIAVARLVLSHSSLALVAGSTAPLAATPQSAAGEPLDRPVTWSSGNRAVATVLDGVVTAVSPGSTTVTASSEGQSASASVRVTPVPVAAVELGVSGDTLDVGQTTILVATVRDAAGAVLTDRLVSWSSSATAIATVADGVVTAVAPGTTTITATSEGQVALAEVLVQRSLEITNGRRTMVPGFEQTCAIATTGDTYCWGWERYGAVGNGRMVNEYRLTAAAVSAGPAFTSLAGGYSHSCGLTAAGAAWCWGRGQLGQSGNGVALNSALPVAVSGGHSFVQLSAGSSDRTCGVTEAGAVWCWGSNFNGSLGAGVTGAGYTAPLRVAGGRVYRQVVAGSGGVCALRDDGAPFCWGSNFYGQLGNGTTGASSVPVEVSGAHRFVQLVAGFGHYCGRKADNTHWCWGCNSNGQPGDGRRVNRPTPVLGQGGVAYTSLAAGATNSCGLSSSGIAMCWGAAPAARSATATR